MPNKMITVSSMIIALLAFSMAPAVVEVAPWWHRDHRRNLLRLPVNLVAARLTPPTDPDAPVR